MPTPDTPGLLPFLPLLYVAWADGDLGPEELALIRARVDGAPGLAPEARDGLARWLDPGAPPSASDLQEMLAAIRGGLESSTAEERRSLADLGIELAHASGQSVDPSEERALRALEEALGLTGPEASRSLLTGQRPAAPPEPERPPSFDAQAMRRLLDGEHAALRDEIREILGTTEMRFEPGLDTEAYRARVLAACRELAARGIGALGFPASAGGGGDYGRFMAAFETLALGDLSVLVKLGVQFGLFGGSILQLGTERHHERYLPRVASLELPGCFAMTETGHGSNVYDLETVAVYEPETREIVITTPHPGARKDYIGGAARDARMTTVFAQLVVGGERHGVHAVLVPIRDRDGRPERGVSIEDCGEKLGLNGVDNGRLSFAGVRVPRENLLDRFGQVSADGRYESAIASPAKRFFTMLGTLVGGRLSVGLASVSAAKLGLAIAVRYGAKRRQFGPEGGAEVPILDYLTHQLRLLPRLATTYALELAARPLIARFLAAGDEDRRELEGEIAGFKALASWHAASTVQECREACGGVGYLAESRLPALRADCDIFTTFEGDNTVLLQLLAKGLLTGYRKQFGAMSFAGLVRYVAEQAGTAISELNPVVTRWTDEDHLRDPELLIGALAWRAEHQLATVARRIKKRLDAGADSFVAVNECQDHLIEAARSHVERQVAERFAAAVEAATGGELAAVLRRLFELHCLWRIEADRGWFLEHGYLEAAKAKAIRKLVVKLCRELRPDAVALVDAFGVPAVCLPEIAG